MTEEKKIILVVEDDPDTSTYFTTLLEDNGYTAISARDGQEGLRKARSEKPHLVLLDLMMPKQSGTDFYRNLIKDKELGSIPVVVVSGTAGSHLAVKNAAAVIEKPADQQELLDTVSRLLSND